MLEPITLTAKAAAEPINQCFSFIVIPPQDALLKYAASGLQH
jgi:hypothetical protein